MDIMKKVISGLEHCIPDPNKSLHEREEENECRHAECPYGGKEYQYGMGCFWSLMSDALALLKEQEAVKPKSKVRHGANAQIQHFCGNCMTMLHGKPKFCSECGRPVLWE